MAMPQGVRAWLSLPSISRVALMLGLGALSAGTTPAEAATAEPAARVPQQSVASLGELRLWSEGERIFVSERGGEARELRLGDTAAARRLRDLLERAGANADAPQIVQDRIILVGGGGQGYSWNPSERHPGAGGSAPAASGPRSTASQSDPTANAPADPAPRQSPDGTMPAPDGHKG